MHVFHPQTDRQTDTRTDRHTQTEGACNRIVFVTLKADKLLHRHWTLSDPDMDCCCHAEGNEAVT